MENENHVIICAERTKKKMMESLKMKENYDAARAKSSLPGAVIRIAAE